MKVRDIIAGFVDRLADHHPHHKDLPASKKQKFEFDAEASKKLAKEAEDEAVRQLEIEQVCSNTSVVYPLMLARMMRAKQNYRRSGCPR